MSVPHSFQAVLFDLDGVLVDSYEVWFRLLAAAARRFRAGTIGRGEFEGMWGQGMAADAERLGCTITELERFYNSHFMDFGDQLRVDPEAAHLFSDLRRAGLGVAVITNTPAALARTILEAARLDPDLLVGGTDVARAKPAPDMVLLACARLAVTPSRALVVGDSPFDRAAAAAAGVSFAGLGIAGDRRLEHLGELRRVLSIDPAPG